MNAVDIGRCSKRIVQYIWDPEPKNDRQPHEPIWCLGVKYPSAEARASQSKTHDDGQKGDERDVVVSTASRTMGTAEHSWPEAFISDFESRIWMTYRSNFIPIPRPDGHDANASMTLSVRLRSQLLDTEGFTSDTGWGCMIRSGQSLLINTMALLLLGRVDWRRGQRLEDEARLLSLFADTPSAPFSIHRFVQHGAQSCGKYPGQWFGPSATARCIEALSGPWKEPSLNVYVTNDTGEVYRDRFLEVARNGTDEIQPTLILVGIRLGIDCVTPVYWSGLKAALQFPQSVGIAGGRPSASHYFVGHQGSDLFYLDPHFTRPAIPERDTNNPYSKDEIDTYHTRRLRRIHMRDMDPSMLIGFLIRNSGDWQDWEERVKSIEGRAIIHVIDEVDNTVSMDRNALDEVEVLDDEE
ncbi:cysteine protease ATG4 [Aspergillus saccharolyticus JOP 1030-1]|uniref:Cysteine protease n=1 Tax=Aspergillus saccharolyticus JOP 1030-1 TaxID=1450539 RepID=A0A318Z4A6_9EURO|nr:putative cysteine protease atg4 [Aspergillus saccharolyticus JOP 1030-1]PYH41157.1 putative cysteine protease atg4 [Aspergillus saccharolyticus JOP 1030-1]